ncbi:MAG: hypothetical protein ABSH09_15645 [Bryobacteraceae bacterium]
MGPATGLKRFVFWDYARMSWQYDVMVGLILLFIFLTPREWFRDQPRPSSIVMVGSPERGISEFWIEPHQLESVPEAERSAKASALLNARFKRHSLVRLEPIFDSEQEIRGYLAYTKP